jgi:GH43 family beta-xylosidase
VAFTNPVALRRADPHVVRHTDGHYYLTATVPAYDRIVIRRATTLQGLATAPETTVWTKHPTGEMGAHIWAPELHFIDGSWYLHVAAGAADDVWRIRPYVLRNDAANPLTGTWTELGRIRLPLDTFSLDATTFTHRGTRYLAWAQHDPAVGSGTALFLAAMADPCTITGTPVRISTPTHAWETAGHRVNEGPAVLRRNGRVFMTFSASATDSNYCMGLLTADADADLLDPASWTKHPAPVFTSNDATGQYGPGHNSFTVSEDGASDILVYHARDYRDIDGEPLDDPNRHTRFQKLYWNADGTPAFGIPVADGPTPVRLAPVAAPGHHVRHRDSRARIDADVTDLADSLFRLAPGPAGGGTVALESANRPGSCLRHRDGEVWLEADDGSAAFRRQVSFHRRPEPAGGVSFEAADRPGHVLRHRDGLLYVEAAEPGGADAVFREE